MLTRKTIERLWDELGVEAYPREGRVDLPLVYIVRFARLVEARALENAARLTDERILVHNAYCQGALQSAARRARAAAGKGDEA